MIIKSLRSTQSSIDMGDDIVGNVPPGQEVHLEACKFGMGPLVGSKSSTGSVMGIRPKCKNSHKLLPLSQHCQLA
ncbi:unnamed protein product [Merluccius merluccius]